MGDPYWDGFRGQGKHVIRTPSGDVQYKLGQRAGGRRGTRLPKPVPIGDAAGFFKVCLFLAAVGAVAGLGYGLWQPFTDAVSPGFGADAMTVLKWIGIGAGAGALAPSALIAAVCLAFLWAIFWGLGLLLNFLTSL